MIETSALQRGGIFLRLLFGIFFVFALLVVGGLFFAHTIRVHENRAQGDVQVDTPFGSLHVEHGATGHSSSGGIPIYPGAQPLHDGDSATVDLSGIFGDSDLHIVAGKWRTSDPIDKVQKYYQDKFPDMSVVQHNSRVEMHSSGHSDKRVIVLRDRGDSTEIALASVGEPRAN